jgi:hypothetical protein
MRCDIELDLPALLPTDAPIPLLNGLRRLFLPELGYSISLFYAARNCAVYAVRRHGVEIGRAKTLDLAIDLIGRNVPGSWRRLDDFGAVEIPQ